MVAALGASCGNQTSYQSSAAKRDFGTPRGGRRTVPIRRPSPGRRGAPSRTMRTDMPVPSSARVTPARYLLIVETGDEVLDYRRAVERYRGAEQVVIEGGDHSLQSFPRHLPRILAFAGLDRA